jgi:PAS domain S-box-containing protein
MNIHNERRQAEAARSQTEQNLPTILDTISDGLFVLDVGWRFTYAHRAAEQILGVAAQSLIGRDIREAYPGLLGTPIEALYREALESCVSRRVITYYPVSEKAIWKMVVRRMKQGGITANITPHSTRHTLIPLALDGGAPLHKVQVAAGHADPRTTERYWRTKENLDDNAVDCVRL